MKDKLAKLFRTFSAILNFNVEEEPSSIGERIDNAFIRKSIWEPIVILWIWQFFAQDKGLGIIGASIAVAVLWLIVMMLLGRINTKTSLPQLIFHIWFSVGLLLCWEIGSLELFNKADYAGLQFFMILGCHPLIAFLLAIWANRYDRKKFMAQLVSEIEQDEDCDGQIVADKPLVQLADINHKNKETHSPVNFIDAIRMGFTQYSSSTGRATRAEFWWWQLFFLGVASLFVVMENWIENKDSFSVIFGITLLALLIPTLNVSIRRLHDIGKNGWWLCLNLLYIVGSIILIIWFCKDSQPQANQYGESPKYR